MPLQAWGERVRVRGSHRRRSKRLPLTPTLSPRKSGEREKICNRPTPHHLGLSAVSDII
jgi:hypothetical protein